MSKRMERLNAWINANPYQLFAHYRDCISDEQAQFLLDGEFESFNESVWEWEINASDYIDWNEWESEFASAANYDEWDSMPEWLQEFAQERRFIDSSDLIEGAIRNYSGHCIAWLFKRNGDAIEFDAWGDSNPANTRYLKRQWNIDNRKSEATYGGTILTALGRIDLLTIYKSQRKPTHIILDSQTYLIGHEPWNGSGTAWSDYYSGPKNKPPVKARFFVDGLNPGYGVDSIFGLSGQCWANDIQTESK